MDGNYYDVLRVTPAATFDEIHRAYRVLAMQYHPDRNSTPGAGEAMAAINEAYAVLSDPSRRKNYDREQGKSDSFDMAGPVLRAARDTLLQQGWVIAESKDSVVVLEKDFRSVRVHFAAAADNEFLKKIARRAVGFTVVVAVEIEKPFNLSFSTAVIDVMRSRYYGAPFPDEEYRKLFSSFV